ncbi:MAG: hypothetical protein ABI823_15020, partial [Bryobacteraceae bacterium]
MRIGRREFLAGSAAAAGLLGAESPLSGEALYRDIKKYWEFGEHRTASDPDNLTTEWLTSELKKAGFEASSPRFTLRQFFPGTCDLTVAGKRIRVFPLWPVAGTAVVTAPLGPGGIAIERLPYDFGGALSKTHPAVGMIQKAAAKGAKALVLVTEGPVHEIIALNYESEVERWPIPVVLMAPKDAPGLAERSEATLTIGGMLMERAVASNAQGLLKRGKKLIIVSTPKSGWFRCAGERGPGIAIWLALARSVGAQRGGPSYLFTANSGHELHGLGIKAFLNNAPKPSEVGCWVHLGAGLATYAYENGKRLKTADTKRYLTSSADVAPVIAPAFAAIPELAPTTERLLGELRYLVAAGYRGFSVAAGHRLHHTPIDDPSSTGGDI